MTKPEAIRLLGTTSSGLIADIIGSTKYKAIDDAVNCWILIASNADDDTFRDCVNLFDIIRIVRRRKLPARYAFGHVPAY